MDKKLTKLSIKIEITKVWVSFIIYKHWLRNIKKIVLNPITPLLYYKILLVIKHTKCDYDIKQTSKWAQNRCPGNDTTWLGITGHVVGVQEVRGTNPVGTIRSALISLEIGKKRTSDRVMKCIQINTNMPGICLVIREIAFEMLKMMTKQKRFCMVKPTAACYCVQ